MRKRWLLCDYGGVLAQDHVDAAEQQLADVFGGDKKMLRSLLTEKSSLGKSIRVDLINEEEFWKEICYKILASEVLPRSPSDLTLMWANTYTVRQSVVNILKFAQASGINIGIATNVDRYREIHLLSRIVNYIENVQIFSSYKCSAIKPSPEFFLYVNECIGFSHVLTDVLYVDDRPEHTRAAEKHGWKSYCFSNTREFHQNVNDWLASHNREKENRHDSDVF